VSKIKAGEEITLTYNWKQLAMKDWKTRQDNLWYNWGFRQAYSSFNNLSVTIILWGKNTIPSSYSRFNSSTVERFFLLTVREFPLPMLIGVVNSIYFPRLWKKKGKVFKGGNYLMKKPIF
jgi:hypothetical protein